MSKKEKYRGGGDLDSLIGSSIPNGKNYLLLIAINEYKDAGFTDLNNCVSDSNKIRDVLLRHYQFEKENIIELYNKEATTNNIIAVFDDFLIGERKLSNQDNLLFLFSGHGMDYTAINKGYWITHESVKGKIGSYLPNSEIIDRLRKIEARHIVGFVDSCYAATLLRSDIEEELKVAKKLFSYPSRYLITAGRLEPVSDGSLGKNSPFANRLTTYLEHNPEPYLWISDLGTSIIKGVVRNANQTPMHAPLQNAGDQGGLFIFLKKGTNFNVIKEKEEIIKEVGNDKGNTKKEKEKKRRRTIWVKLILEIIIGATIFFLIPTMLPILGNFPIPTKEMATFEKPKIKIYPDSFSVKVPEENTLRFHNFICTIYNIGKEELKINRLSNNQPWMTTTTDKLLINSNDSAKVKIVIDKNILSFGENNALITLENNDTTQHILFTIFHKENISPPPPPIQWDTIACKLRLGDNIVTCQGIVIEYTFKDIPKRMESKENGDIEIIFPKNWRVIKEQIKPITYSYPANFLVTPYTTRELFTFANGCLILPDNFQFRITNDCN